jgi:putative ABC transport system ATP-binding protein
MREPIVNVQSSAQNGIAVAVRSVWKSFGSGPTRLQVLRGVDLDVRYGQMTYLLGPSGSGKTTLLSIIAGLLRADSGSVTVLGRDLARLRNGEAALFRLRNLGFVFQQFNLIPALTAAENVAVPLLAAGVPRREAVERARGLLADLGMGHRADELPSKLSGGEQQRTAFARAMIQSPRLIICDEPTSALDGPTGRRVMELLRKHALSPDRAVLVVTHDFRILEFADTVAEINDGVIVKVTEATGVR